MVTGHSDQSRDNPGDPVKRQHRGEQTAGCYAWQGWRSIQLNWWMMGEWVTKKFTNLEKSVDVNSHCSNSES